MSENLLNLYKHNQESYSKIQKAYELGEKVVGIIHATGTGKTYNALQLAYDNQDKKIIYVVPNRSIIEHIYQLIEDNKNLDIHIDFKHVKFVTYTALTEMTKTELEKLDIDMMILDEFHHIGAPVWGEAISTLVESHNDLLIFGMTAYSVRDRGTQYERDMAEDNGKELFSDKIVSRYNLVDAMIEGVLPVPIYKSAYVDLLDFVTKLENKIIKKSENTPQITSNLKILNDIKAKIINNLDTKKLLLQNIKKNGKYIYFCPAISENNQNDIHTIMKEMREFLYNNGYKYNDFEFYFTTASDAVDGKKNRIAFYNDINLEGKDASNKLRIMFAINQYNEGVHAPNVDGVILGRGTKSDIVYFEQIGRSLSVRGNTTKQIEKLKKLNIETINYMCKQRNIPTNGLTKDDMIERLVAPTIIDLTGNISFIKDLATELKHRIKEKSTHSSQAVKTLNITDRSFDINIIGQDLVDTLNKINNEFLPNTWDESYALAKKYYETYRNLNISRKFKTEDGVTYNEYGYALGEWLAVQKREYSNGKLSPEKIKKLEELKIVWKVVKTWEESYLLAKKYYEVHNNLLINCKFKTLDGYSYNENGYNLGAWIVNQRRKYKLNLLNSYQISKLESIGIVWQVIKTFDEIYEYVLDYFKKYGNINIEKDYYTEDGYHLGGFIYNQKILKKEGKLSNERIELFNKLGMDWSIKTVKKNPSWDEMFKLASIYFFNYGNLNVSRNFVTKDGITSDENGYFLGRWISRQRVKFKNGKLTQDQIKKLESIGMKWNLETSYKTWDQSYELAVEFFLKYGHLNVKSDYVTECGYNLGAWIYLQRKYYINGRLSDDQIQKLNMIGMIWNVSNNYSKIKELLKQNNINYRKHMTYLKQFSVIEIQAKIKYLISKGYDIIVGKELHEIFKMSNINMQIKYGISREELIKTNLEIAKKV